MKKEKQQDKCKKHFNILLQKITIMQKNYLFLTSFR
jgi:hypothetical protein